MCAAQKVYVGRLDFAGLLNGKNTNEFLVTDFVSPAQLHTASILKSPSPERNGTVIRRNSSVSPINNVIQTPVSKLNNNVHIRGCTSTAPGIEEAQTPFANLTNTSCSKDWLLSSGEKSESIEQRRKLKRLRKVGDCGKSRNLKSVKENGVPIANLARSFTSPFRNKCVRGTLNSKSNASNCLYYPVLEFANISTENLFPLNSVVLANLFS